MNLGSRCFVAMPFRPELNFFFLYMRQFLHDRCSLDVERGDAQILTAPLAEKIRQQIRKADLVIADITGANPNVFYEVGLAHAANIPVLRKIHQSKFRSTLGSLSSSSTISQNTRTFSLGSKPRFT